MSIRTAVREVADLVDGHTFALICSADIEVLAVRQGVLTSDQIDELDRVLRCRADAAAPCLALTS